jgi:NAD(P)-dependent dehydrogenase (short-subunit alcohol dehydrogenase family)
MTYKSVPLLLASPASRIIFITSGTSTLEGTSNVALPFNHSPPAGWPKPNLQLPAYRSSKTGMNMMVLEWRRILRADSVKIVCVSPGYLATGLGKGLEYNKKMGAIDPEIGAEFVRDCVEGQRDADAEKGIVNKSGMQPW